MHSSCRSQTRTKDEFLSQAHEARLARELARRRDNSAIILQSYIRRYLTCRRLKKQLHEEHDVYRSAYDLRDSSAFTKSIRRILFFSLNTKDNELIDSVSEYLYEKWQVSQQTPNADAKQSVIEEDAAATRTPNDIILLFVDEASKDEQSFRTCAQVLSRLVEACCRLLSDRIAGDRPRISSLVTYLGVINMLTIEETSQLSSIIDSMKINDTSREKDACGTQRKLVSDLSASTFRVRYDAFLKLSDAIAKTIKGPRTDAKVNLLSAYVKLALNIYSSVSSKNWPLEEQTKFFVKLFSVPALIHHLERFSIDSITAIKDNTILNKCFQAMATQDQHLHSLSSTPALCLVANLVHLTSLTGYMLSNDLIKFIITITKLLECCQKNMKQIKACNEVTGSARKETKKGNDATDESYNHILGWLIRETAHTNDQETSELIRSQLSHLWSVKFLKLLLSDLIKANENWKCNKSHTADGKNKVAKDKELSKEPAKDACQDETNQKKCDTHTQGTTMVSFKRVVERAAHTMSKSIGYTYNKTNSSSSLQYGSSRLMTEESRRISLVCLMLHTALKTLRMVKQDMLIGLCFHDYVLRNLWDYICSLSPNNGLKAFLDHLIINSKSSIPEFHILMLFCECTSHIIGILDDSELYEQQRPFSLDQLITMSSSLNIFVFRIINNQLVPYKTDEIDPMLRSTHKLLTDLYKRDCRRVFAPEGHWLIKDVKMTLFLKDLDAGRPVAQTILNLLPHIIPHKERVLIFRKLVARDRSPCYSTFITIHRSRIVEDGYQQIARLPSTALKGLIRVKFINDHGLDEAGIDQDGVFKEFLEDTIKRVFDPSLNLFSTTSEQRLYPSPTSRLHEDHLSLFTFVGKMLGKAVYEGIVVDVPFATFFLARVLGQHHSQIYSPIDELASLDPELYKNLIYIRHHDVSDLDLTFSIDQDMMGKIENFELEPGGRHIPVTNQNRVRYIHSVANFRMRTQIEEQTKAFIRGFKSIVNLEWLHMFSASEFQRLISGDTAPIDLQDLRRHTKYFGGFHNNHRVVCWLWDILESDFTPEEHSLFLKFVTSCSKPPLLGFENLEPPFSIRCVEVSDDQDLGDTVGSVLRGFFAIRRSDPVDRLPTSSTCFNLLKLPNYQRRSTLREKLRYAIRSGTGFELS